MDKRQYYDDSDVARDYVETRYAGAGGQYVNARETSIAIDLLPDSGHVLDLPTGVGRLVGALRVGGLSVTGADYSLPMLHVAQQLDYPAVRADAFRLPFADNCFDALVSIRFVFHYADPLAFFAEAYRVLRPGGVLVFDTYNWSPFMIPGVPFRWGGSVFIFRQRQLRQWADASGFEVGDTTRAFLCSPVVYRHLPAPGVKVFDWLERRLPAAIRNVCFWQWVSRKPSDEGT